MKGKASMEQSGYRRIILKVTGESLSGEGAKGVSQEHLSSLAQKLVKAAETGLEIAIVVGGGNLLRGANFSGSKMVRTFAAHQMGMVATVINGMALSETLVAMGKGVKLMSAFAVGNFVQPYNVVEGRACLSAGNILVLAGGTGSPYVTTDTCAAIRAAELGADAVFKATKVPGVFSEDPKKNPNAVKYDTISFDETINKRLGVIDLTAVRICQEAKVPIVVFNFSDLDHLDQVIAGKISSSVIKG
jgi:uridylate kinase